MLNDQSGTEITIAAILSEVILRVDSADDCRVNDIRRREWRFIRVLALRGTREDRSELEVHAAARRLPDEYDRAEQSGDQGRAKCPLPDDVPISDQRPEQAPDWDFVVTIPMDRLLHVCHQL
ncbi:MAG TPA: hypothetical protein VMO26_01200 [Vicinamibacterales bacterium]|nr:hypothetical protein [Vicinamibacterales bacterium]